MWIHADVDPLDMCVWCVCDVVPDCLFQRVAVVCVGWGISQHYSESSIKLLVLCAVRWFIILYIFLKTFFTSTVGRQQPSVAAPTSEQTGVFLRLQKAAGLDLLDKTGWEARKDRQAGSRTERQTDKLANQQLWQGEEALGAERLGVARLPSTGDK